jgi:arsenite methyltransferase
MTQQTYYSDHWAEIEDERFERYNRMFAWRPELGPLFEPAEIEAGQDILDVGCGPGFAVLEFAQVVGPTGSATGVDLNARFIDEANQRAETLDNVSFVQVDDHVLPFADASFDRVICKNVLEYVPSASDSLREVHRVTRPGGKVHVIDSDWGFLILEPWGKETVDRFFAAASPAFREPHIGRKAAGALASAGFSDVRVQIEAIVDQEGMMLDGFVANMAGYIRTFQTMPDQEVDGLLDAAREAVGSGRYFACVPQFLVTATR